MTPSGIRRVRAERKGRLAETAALWILRLKGYRLLAKRFKTPLGEVDLVMRRGTTTVFVEVKARITAGHALDSVSVRQARRIAAAARLWTARDPRAQQGFCRFDIVAVSPYHWPCHIENAFSGE